MNRSEMEQRRMLTQVVNDRIEDVNKAFEMGDRAANKLAFCELAAILETMNQFCSPSWKYARDNGMYRVDAVRLKGLVF